MKPLRLLALAIAATTWCATAAFACDGAKTSAANATSCGSKSTTATAAHAGCAMSKTTTASAADCCAGKSKTTATTAAATKGAACQVSGNCPMSAEQCKAMQASGACTAEMKAACAAKGAKTAAAGQCAMHATAASQCVVCADQGECDDDVKATGARAQVVALRNGSMIVYTLDNPENVRALQAAVARHNLGVVTALQGDAKLCASCKKLRGALASGKLVREVINVERGCQLLITSTDRSIVEQVHACTNAQMAARTTRM